MAVLLLTRLDAVIMHLLYARERNWIPVFAILGMLFSLAYTGFFQRIALGELAAFLVWGPLMIGGTVYAIAGGVGLSDWLLTLPYGLVVASVLVGKHIDKRQADKKVGARSLPVIIGQRASLKLEKALFIIFYLLIIALVAFRVTGPGVLLTFFALPQLHQAWNALSRPRPATAPEGWSVWPLWYVAWAMLFNRRAGELFVLGLGLNVLAPWLQGALGI